MTGILNAVLRCDHFAVNLWTRSLKQLIHELYEIKLFVKFVLFYVCVERSTEGSGKIAEELLASFDLILPISRS